MNLAEPIPDPLSIELLGTRRCLEIGPSLNDFENEVFGPDFFCPFQRIEPWVHSGSLFYAAVCGEAVAGRRTILGLGSIFITSSASRDLLFQGRIADYELSPWFVCPVGSEPSAYLSSIVSHNPAHRVAIFESLWNELHAYVQVKGFQVKSGFAIATGPAGYKHLFKSGFVPVLGAKYLHKYDFMTIDASTAATAFWHRLLNPRATICESASLEAEPSERLALEGAPPSNVESAQNVEKPWALSKAERYQQPLAS
jgi:hypothetical protein